MSTILDALASTHSISTPPRIAFAGLDAEEVSDVSERYDVSQVPLVVLQKDGQTLEAVTGTDAARLRAAVEKYAGRTEGGSNKSLPPAQQVTRPVQPLAGGLAPVVQEEESGEPVSKEELHGRLGELVKAAPVMLFMKGTPSAPECGFSRRTVAMLRERGVRYGFFNILADDEVRQGLKEFSEWPTFPQVYVGGEFVGGLDIVS